MRVLVLLILFSFCFLGPMTTHCRAAGHKPLPIRPTLSVSFEGTNSITLSYDTKGFPFSHPRINAKINGIPGWFAIDTGTVMPLLSKQAVRRCGITVLPSRDKMVDRGHMLAM